MAASGKTEKKKGGGLIGTIAPALGLTVLAAGGGIALGRQIASPPAAVHAAAEAAATESHAVVIRELTPIVTNLAGTGNTWMRLQTAIVYDKGDAAQMDLIASNVADDTLAFVRTLTVAELQGASGLQHLREDLNERANLRSDGKIKEMVIETMVIQ